MGRERERVRRIREKREWRKNKIIMDEKRIMDWLMDGRSC